MGLLSLFEVFKRATQPLNAGIVASAAFNSFLEFLGTVRGA